MVKVAGSPPTTIAFELVDHWLTQASGREGSFLASGVRGMLPSAGVLQSVEGQLNAPSK